MHIVSNSSNATWPIPLHGIRDVFADEFAIHYSTVQIEETPCEQAQEARTFDDGIADVAH
jgi:cobalt-zinc-cadmium efflux system protein